MYKKIWVKTFIVVLLICFAGSMAYSSNDSDERIVNKAVDAIKNHPDEFGISLEQFEQDIKKYPVLQVVYAARLAALYGKNIEEIYELMANYEDYRDIGKYLAETETPKKELHFKDEEEPIDKNIRIYDKRIVGDNSPDLTKEELTALKKAYTEKMGETFSVLEPDKLSQEGNQNDEEKLMTYPTAEEMKQMSFEERQRVYESKLREETDHDYKYIYMFSLLDNENNTICEVYHKVCVNGLCKNCDGGYYTTKSRPLTSEKASTLEKLLFGYNDPSISKEPVETINIAGQYSKYNFTRD